ncbi:general amidase [Metarhizium acridum CQMa 102]|uniref:General amidase n=1 Tax=Metarhizium acridum (strain CQMa 102) TaxID=655827 RepID=E9E3C1_METAQ|nr:general amidase [Metarhizium acridum CQMa 102]EFY89514.1 general amidase [Metarhizium acridum CQMa 102]
MNPVNQLLSCGGSSGGEGALLALGASNVGVGTDIGKHIPANTPYWADLFAFRPHFVERALSSHPGGASPYRTVANSSPGQSICPSAIGFMSTSLLGLKLIMTSLFSTEPWLRDLSVVPMPWRAEKESIRGKLCFAVLRNDRMVQPHPPIARGIEIVADAVQNSGHTDIILDTGGGDDVWRQLNILHEPVIPQVSERFGNGPKDPVPTLELLDIVLKHEAYVARYLKYWASTITQTGTGRAVDAVILPVAPHAAVVPGEYYHYGYTEFVNLLDFSSAVLPVTKADKDMDVARGDFKPLTPKDEINWRAYNADTYACPGLRSIDGSEVRRGANFGHCHERRRTLEQID